MSASPLLRSEGSPSRDTSDFVDKEFFLSVIEALEQLLSESRCGRHPMIAFLLDIARVEAEDELRTDAEIADRFSEFQEVGMTRILEDLSRKIGCTIPNDVTSSRESTSQA